MTAEIYPLTPERWQDFETLFGPHGAYGGCWCMWWRQTRREFERCKGEENRALFKAVVERGEMPGLLAYVDGQPAGWMALAPREQYPSMQRSKVMAAVDSQPAWVVSCFYMGKPFRRQGLMVELLRAGVKFAAERGAKIIEGYPTDPGDKPHVDAFVYTGLLSAFLRAGFKEVARRTDKRPIMRYEVE